MSNYPYDINQLWEVTNFGLDFWHSEFPESIGLENKNKHFKTHNENTPSTTLTNKLGKNGVYVIYNHSSKEKHNAIDYVAKERGLEFKDALQFLCEKYGIAKTNVHSFKPTTEFKDCDKEIGTFKLKTLKKYADYKFFAPFLTDDICKRYNFKSVEQYSKVVLSSKTEKATEIIVTATADYPIFAYDNKDFAKMYEPKANKNDKYSLKHHFLGTKPESFIYGWEWLFEQVDETYIDVLYKQLKEATSPSERKSILEQINNEKLKEVFICTGGSDGMNLASLGYYTIWFNSEAEIITKEQMRRLQKICKQVYYVPDLDNTGIKQATALGLKHLKCKIVFLPKDLIAENKKDVADWVRKLKNLKLEQVKAMFEQIKSLALEFQFWDKDEKTTKINPKKTLNFLKYNDFRLYKQPYKTNDTGKEDDGYFLRVENNVIQQTYPSDIRKFTTDWLDENYIDIKVYNQVIRSNIFNANTLKALPYYEFVKNSCGVDFQYYFFKNCICKVTANGIEKLPYVNNQINVWEENIIDHIFDIKKPCFEIYEDEFKRKRIKITDNYSNYFKVLINTSRIFWQKDADLTGKDTNNFNIASNNLSADENYLQELHLMNKMYCVGYLLHQYKVLSNAKMVLGMDYAGGQSIKTSKGGTGKTFLLTGLSSMLKTRVINGENLNNPKNSFPLNGVTPRTQFVVFDDLSPYQNMRYFYTLITSNFEANQKGGVIYDIPFKDSAKIGATTNFAPNDVDESTLRRLLAYYNSDYYHKASENNNYAFSRAIKDDFGGKDIMTNDYGVVNWNNDYNFQLQCIQFYLQCSEPVETPIDTMIEKNRWQKIGDDFRKCFDKFFADDDRKDKYFEKSALAKYYLDDFGGTKTKQKLNEALEEYCKAMNWGLEEKRVKNLANNSVPQYFVTTDKENEAVAKEESLQAIEAETKDTTDFFDVIDNEKF